MQAGSLEVGSISEKTTLRQPDSTSRRSEKGILAFLNDVSATVIEQVFDLRQWHKRLCEAECLGILGTLPWTRPWLNSGLQSQ